MDWTSSEPTNTIARDSTFVPSQRTNDMMKIEENPENEFLDDGKEEKKMEVRLNDEEQRD